MFEIAKPIFIQGKSKDKNTTAFFVANFECEGENGVLKVTASSRCKVTINGDFVCFTAPQIKDYYITYDEIDISNFISWGLNQIVIEVASYNINNCSGFLLAEIVADEKLVAATGKNFAGFIDLERQPKSSVRTDGIYTENYIRSGCCLSNMNVEILKPQYLTIKNKEVWEYEITQPDDMQLPILINNGESVVFDMGKSVLGFVKMFVTVRGKSKLKVGLGKSAKADSNEINYTFNDGCFECESFEPYELRYIKISVEEGQIDLGSLEIRQMQKK